MDGETVDTVTGWESEPLSGGMDGLRALAAREFTGAVTEGRAWLFMLNGRVVGVFEGPLEAFEDADGTAYAAPDPSLALLFAMRETGGETKARYYTNDTALSAADAKLSSGKFTGYIDLSENVLSGDYYAIYYAGRRLACAFVGTGEQKQVLTGEEAFEAADDEVGIYEVVGVDVDVVELPDADPEPADDPVPADDPEPAGGAGLDADAAAAGPAGIVAADGSDDGVAGDAAAGDDPGSVTIGAGAAGPADPEDATVPGDTTDTEGPAAAPDADANGADGGPDAEGSDEGSTDARSTGAGVADAEAPDAGDVVDTPADAAADRSAGAAAALGTEEPSADDADDGDRESDGDGDPFSAEEQWRETRSIPSLDPSRTSTAEEDDTAANGGARRARRARRGRSDARSTGSGASSGGDPSGPSRRNAGNAGNDGSDADPAAGRDADPQPAPGADGAADDAASDAAGGAGGEGTVRDLAAARAERDRARQALHDARGDLEATEEEVARLREENDRLADRVDELESALAETRDELAAARTAGGSGDGDAGGAPSRTVPADRALEGTNLFVRYDSKGGATLSKAHAGGARRSDVNDNLRLEVHTDFEAADAAVDGRPYREFLEDTIEYGFVEWAVRQLLYEIQSTGNESALRDLFDAIPEIDRAELNGAVVLDDGEGETSEHRFDVVLRDRMGNPLVVADVTEGRDATTESMLDSLVGDASAVGGATEHLAAGFYVTASFFDPGALEAAADATGGGLLSRGKRKSFVKLSRKQGFHLCLVESREGEFHVNVPEL